MEAANGFEKRTFNHHVEDDVVAFRFGSKIRFSIVDEAVGSRLENGVLFFRLIDDGDRSSKVFGDLDSVESDATAATVYENLVTSLDFGEAKEVECVEGAKRDGSSFGEGAVCRDAGEGALFREAKVLAVGAQSQLARTEDGIARFEAGIRSGGFDNLSGEVGTKDGIARAANAKCESKRYPKPQYGKAEAAHFAVSLCCLDGAYANEEFARFG